jgi:hypothetical protein
MRDRLRVQREGEHAERPDGAGHFDVKGRQDGPALVVPHFGGLTDAIQSQRSPSSTERSSLRNAATTRFLIGAATA